MVEVLVCKIGVGPGGCDRLGAAAIPGRFGLDAVQIQREGAGKPLFRGDLFLLGQQGQNRVHVLFVAVHLLFLGDDLRLTADDDLSQHIGAVVQEAIPLKLPHGERGGVGIGREIIHLADLLVVLVEDDIDREHGVRIRHVQTDRARRQRQHGQKQERCGER